MTANFKNLKKIMFSTLSALLVMCMSIMPTYANENSGDSYISVPVNESEVWVFPTKDDYESYLEDNELQENESTVTPRIVTEHEVSRTTWYHKWVCYHWLTPSWTKASSYTISAGSTVSGSVGATYGGINFTLSLSKTQGATATLRANSSKYSKLSLSGDFLVKKMVRFYHDNSGVYDQYNYISYSTLNSYIDVTYQ